NCVIQEDVAIGHGDGDIFTLQRGSRFQGHNGFRHHRAVNDVVEQDVGQCASRVFQQAFNGAFGQSGKGVIGGGKDGEGAFAGEGFNQASGVQSSHQGGETAVGHGNFG